MPLWLLLWSVETALTTGVCIVDVGWWEGYTGEERRGLYGVYGPYLGIGEWFLYCFFMCVGGALGVQESDFCISVLCAWEGRWWSGVSELCVVGVDAELFWYGLLTNDCVACLMGIDMFIRVRRQLLRYEGVKDKDA